MSVRSRRSPLQAGVGLPRAPTVLLASAGQSSEAAKRHAAKVDGKADGWMPCGLVAVAAASPSALAEEGAIAQTDRQALVQGLQAQFEVALIRERKMADDRETELIGVLEARLRAARVQADAARGDARAANAALAAARADYAKLAGQIATRDPASQADVAAYHDQHSVRRTRLRPRSWPRCNASLTATAAGPGRSCNPSSPPRTPAPPQPPPPRRRTRVSSPSCATSCAPTAKRRRPTCSRFTTMPPTSILPASRPMLPASPWPATSATSAVPRRPRSKR